MDIYGNGTTFNMELVLHENIQSSLYYNKTCKQMDWSGIIDEMYEVSDQTDWLMLLPLEP